MNDSTIDVPAMARSTRGFGELVSSMRFAISLLTVICIASVVGTVLKQHEPFPNYVNQFGPFWADVFGRLGLYAVYSAGWFLTILAFLVISTTLCIARNTPKILADLKAYKEHLREQSLSAFHHHAQGRAAAAPDQAAREIGEHLARGGWKVRLQQREHGWMVAAKAGAANKIGYLAAHSAIVLICLGGLFDGDLVVRAQTWFSGKTPYTGSGLIADVPPQHRLSTRNPTFRGNVAVPEGAQSSTAILNMPDGILLQELPFSIELRKFIVEYYSTGMPKLFASEIVIHDRETGEKLPARVEVNRPASYKGVEIYQSSFDDGGSRVKLQAVPLRSDVRRFDVEGQVGGSTEISNARERLALEFTGLRVINVEDMGSGRPREDVASGPVDVRSVIEARLGAGHKTTSRKELKNVGPSISYKLRDSAGQAREFQNYMLPIDMGDGVSVFLLGSREKPSDPMRYMRVPADDKGTMEEFSQLRLALDDEVLRGEAVRRYVAQSVDPSRRDLTEQLNQSAGRALALFAGLRATAGPRSGGLQAVSDFIESNVPEAERGRAGEVIVRILNGVLYTLDGMVRERAGLKPREAGPATQAFMTQAVLALSDTFVYPAPMAFQLQDFTQVQASVFQVTRAPGKTIVYLGCLLLILGVFAMLYIRERRLWVWAAPAASGESGCRLTMALSTNRRTLDTDREFERLRAQVLTGRKDTAE